MSESLLQQGTPEDNISLLASITGSTPIPLGNYYSRNMGKGFESRKSRNSKCLTGLKAENYSILAKSFRLPKTFHSLHEFVIKIYLWQH